MAMLPNPTMLANIYHFSYFQWFFRKFFSLIAGNPVLILAFWWGVACFLMAGWLSLMDVRGPTF
jgi:hypothetical protein